MTRTRHQQRRNEQNQHNRRAPMFKPTKNHCRNCRFEYPHPGGAENCPAAISTCRYCKNKGHVERVCRKKKAHNNGCNGQNGNTGTPPLSRPRERTSYKAQKSANSASFSVRESQPTCGEHNEDQDYVYQASSKQTKILPQFEIIIARTESCYSNSGY